MPIPTNLDDVQFQPEETRLLNDNQRIADKRLTEIKRLDTPQNFWAPASLTEWEKRRSELRKEILISCGLWPETNPKAINVEVFDKVEYPGYTVEKVLMKTLPGYYATGNLFRPIDQFNRPHQHPAVLCPHGHWEHGRFENSEVASVVKRAIDFARQGYICLTYDMVGFGDNKKLLDHNFGSRREMIWGITPASFQLRTSLCALNFLLSLKEVDPDKIACTGASGGGTQTFLLYAVDDRVRVAAPVNMISAHMQGGCKCENPPSLRIDTNNLEIGAMMAPRPLMMVCATGDWTRNTPTIEFPAIESVYNLYKARFKVSFDLIQGPHNYNAESRRTVYRWFAQWLDLPDPDSVLSEYSKTEDPPVDSLAVFATRPLPDDVKPEQELFGYLRKHYEDHFLKLMEDINSPEVHRHVEGYRRAIGVSWPEQASLHTENNSLLKRNDCNLRRFFITNPQTGQRIPANLWSIQNTPSNQVPFLLIHPSGKSGWVGVDGKLNPCLVHHLENGSPVLAIDHFGSGEYRKAADWIERHEGVQHFETYNRTDTVLAIQDILTAAAWLEKEYQMKPGLIGEEGVGGLVLLAHGLAEETGFTEVNLKGLNTQEDEVFLKELYIPNIRFYGDFLASVIAGKKRPINIRGCDDPILKERLLKVLPESAIQ